MAMVKEAVQKVLDAFLGLLTQPFEQSLKASVTAAATAISLAGLESLMLLLRGGSRMALDFSGSSLVLVLIWMVVTAVVSRVERRSLAIARNLSVVSFWIAVTLVFIIAAEIVFPNPLDHAIRFLCVLIALLVLVPVHMFRNLSIFAALRMTLALLASTVGLAWKVLA